MAYRLVLVHDGDDFWADEVEDTIRSTLAGIGVPDDALETADAASLGPANSAGTSPPTVVVYLGSVAAAGRDDIDQLLSGAVAAAHAVIPLHPGTTDVAAVMPPSMKRLNAVDWSTSAERASLTILRSLGIAEDARRLFLSYRRTETSELALQLHTALNQRGYDVFLDRFSVPAGVDFQRRIELDLADKAFVLFLESPAARESEWVEEEVAYAMTHHISHLSLCRNDVPRDRRFPTVDDAFRHELDPAADFEADEKTLTVSALSRVLDEIEVRYAKLVRRRRDEILGSVTQRLTGHGYQVTAAGDWAVLALAGERPSAVYLTTPRPADPRDLYTVQQLRAALAATAKSGDGPVRGVVVHPAADLDVPRKDLVAWIAGLGSLSVRFIDDGAAW